MLLDGEVVVGVVALRISLVEYEILVRDAVHAHVHNRLVTHAHRHAPVAAARVVTVRVLSALLTIAIVAHAVLVIVVRLASWALRVGMLEPFLRALNLRVVVRLHRPLL